MTFLLDTHALVWWWTDDDRLPEAARRAIAQADNTVLVSAASAWEIATMHRIGKWPEVAKLIEQFDELLRRSRFAPLGISVVHARRAGSLPGDHRDPFDRMLVAQAEEQTAILISGDRVFRHYNVPVMWDGARDPACP
ncbi:MAG TPA: type II toxin-antitoxin system VapC family toxin [Acetobacteraceae bacterium]|nr:type II toxin-antitoxin system VapC family toxin [Acetobacteraceae bacterium]